MHAAAILDDTIISNLDSGRLKKVLAPKVAGAEHLDRMTRNLPLDYFVLFSSATTVIGNPGQSSYVAANGFLEGLARRRRAAGEPALAIAWGAIADAGMLARHSTARETLANRAGVEGMLARTALNLMGEALSRSESPSSEAVLVIGEINWTFARSHLPLLQSPSFDDLVRETDVAEAGAQQKIDVNHIVATRSSGEALKLIADVIVLEIAHILRLPQETLNRTKPLAEIGLDSLMAAELGVKLEERLTLEAPLSASAGSFNVVDLADHILGLCVNAASREDGAPPQDAVARDLAARHLGAGIDAAALAPLAALVEEKSRDLTKILQ
jgi:acyl carrier protein